jgi:NAD(P)-dependent dehydrogenase (short-subunit alcohol dehydrogenase family)
MFVSDLLQGQTIIVTGGGSGLGKSMATRYAELGANVVLAARSFERLEATAQEIEGRGGQALPVAVDIRDPDACAAVVTQAVERFGGVTGLMNNAAGNFLCPAEDLSPNGFSAVVDIVLKGSWFMTQAVGRQLIAQGRGGSIVSILTTYVYTGSSFVVPSAMAKAGLLAMTKSLAVEWGSAYDIRVNGIAPGPFPTEGAWSALVPDPKAAEEEAKKRIPMKRFGDHAELANLAAYLMSPMAGYVNGTCIDIDGGEWLQGAGEFNRFVELDRANLKQLLGAMRPKKK